MNRLIAIYQKLHETDPGTWIGHLLLGLAGFWLGYWPVRLLLDLPLAAAIAAGILAGFLVVAVAFWYREMDNLLEARVTLGSWRAVIRQKCLDGKMDLISPLLGTFCSMNGVLGGFVAFAGSLLGALAFIGIVAAYTRRHSKKGN